MVHFMMNYSRIIELVVRVDLFKYSLNADEICNTIIDMHYARRCSSVSLMM